MLCSTNPNLVDGLPLEILDKLRKCTVSIHSGDSPHAWRTVEVALRVRPMRPAVQGDTFFSPFFLRRFWHTTERRCISSIASVLPDVWLVVCHGMVCESVSVDAPPGPTRLQYVKPNFKVLFVCQWQIVTSCRMKNCGPCAQQQQQPTTRSPVGAMASGSHNHTVSARFCGLRRHLFFLRFFP